MAALYNYAEEHPNDRNALAKAEDAAEMLKHQVKQPKHKASSSKFKASGSKFKERVKFVWRVIIV